MRTVQSGKKLFSFGFTFGATKVIYAFYAFYIIYFSLILNMKRPFIIITLAKKICSFKFQILF